MKKLNDEFQQQIEMKNDIIAKLIERVAELYAENQMWRSMFAVSRMETDDEDYESIH